MLTDAMRSELTAIPGLTVLTEPDDLERYSRDAYDYSPVLRERLADCRADVVVRPDSVDAVVQVWRGCAGAMTFRSPCVVRAPAITASVCRSRPGSSC